MGIHEKNLHLIWRPHVIHFQLSQLFYCGMVAQLLFLRELFISPRYSLARTKSLFSFIEMFIYSSTSHASRILQLLFLLTLINMAATDSSGINVGSFSGKVTKAELQSFSEFAKTLTPGKDNLGNEWAQGNSGENTKAIGLVYLIGGEQATLDQMIRFCDAVLSQRNDLAKAPTGQHKIWTGRIDPVWPNTYDGEIPTGGEQGDPVGHLASCAYLILKTKALYDEKVTIGDPHNYGATYYARALTFLKGADDAMSGHILKSQLDLSRDNKMYFAKGDPYKGGDAVPWNQQMMFNYAFQNLCSAHRILGDNPALLAKYKSIIIASLNWFFTGGGATKKPNPKGDGEIYYWDYAPGGVVEDSNHASLDIAGFARAYISADYGITKAQMKTLANTFVDVMTLTPLKKYAGTVDGQCKDDHAACTGYIRSGFLFLAEFRSAAYESMMKGGQLSEGGTTKGVAGFSRFLWVKHQLSK